MDRECGNTPSSRPVRNTTGNSSPLAECSVIRVTPPADASSSSVSATRAIESRKASRVTDSTPAASWLAMSSSDAATSSSRFSSRASASAVRSAFSASR